MFERRLRLFLLFVFLFGLVLAGRAAQVQVLDRDHWDELAKSSAARVQHLPARRGNLLDVAGRVIAQDVTKFDLAVNFRVVPSVPDADWLKAEATRRARLLPEYQAATDPDARVMIVWQETQRVRADLETMWDAIARITQTPRSTIDATRRAIADDVKDKHDSFVRRRLAEATDAYQQSGTPPWYVRWVAGTREPPDEDAIRAASTIDDQEAFHTIVSDLSPTMFNELALAQEHFPQFRDVAKRWQSLVTLRPSIQREYPFGDTAAHVIGHVGLVTAEDRENDPNKGDERRRYTLVDRIGRDGLERLAEPQLRGRLGQATSDRAGGAGEIEVAEPGQNVTSTLDIELQRDIQLAFRNVDFQHPEKDATDHYIRERLSMNGAAVVIDIKTGEVRALVSVPTFDLNRFDELYDQLLADDLNGPLRNRALLDALEPGSSVKPIVGLAAVTQKLISAGGTVHCDGYAHLNGRTIQKPRCWTMSIFKGTHQSLSHPHPTGDLTLADAIERSCNVYFLTLGDKLGIEGLSYWMRKFGYGEITGVGLPESRGLVPMMARISTGDRPSSAWYSSIGQGPVNATPIQVCNEIATIARDGVWVRPRLLHGITPPPTTRPSGELIPERVDLNLDPAALRAVHEGMKAVVNSEAGTGKLLKRDDVLVAAKTGSATAVPLTRPRRDEAGNLLRVDGKLQYEVIPYGAFGRPNTDLPWYRRSGWDDRGRDKGTHSWVAGYAPADNPQIAFAVYVEYGGSGGIGAGSVATKLLDSCIARGYVTAKTTPNPAPTAPPSLAVPINTED